MTDIDVMLIVAGSDSLDDRALVQLGVYAIVRNVW